MLSEYMLNNPILGIFLLSILINVFITLVYKYMTDQERLKHIRAEMKKIRAEMKEARNDPQRMAEMNKKPMEHSGEQMRQQFKPMLITLVPIFFIWGWLRELIPLEQILIEFPFSIPKAGLNTGMGWFGVYLITAIIFSSLFKKLFKVY